MADFGQGMSAMETVSELTTILVLGNSRSPFVVARRAAGPFAFGGFTTKISPNKTFFAAPFDVQFDCQTIGVVVHLWRVRPQTTG
jgi:hypothetical protein